MKLFIATLVSLIALSSAHTACGEIRSRIPGSRRTTVKTASLACDEKAQFGFWSKSVYDNENRAIELCNANTNSQTTQFPADNECPTTGKSTIPFGVYTGYFFVTEPTACGSYRYRSHGRHVTEKEADLECVKGITWTGSWMKSSFLSNGDLVVCGVMVSDSGRKITTAMRCPKGGASTMSGEIVQGKFVLDLTDRQ